MERPIEKAPGLFFLPLPLPAPGFSSFIGSWLYKKDGLCFLADPGPGASVPELCSALSRLGVGRLDFILLTHIHLDHAGGCGNLLEALGPCPVVCHPKATAHLADPARLWEGSVKTLGELARAYGQPKPVNPGLLVDATGFGEAGIRPVPTPGHAPHHVSFLFSDILIAGETGGVYVDQGGGLVYLRPATPPRFFFETSMESLDILARTPHRIYCYGHTGAVESSAGLLAAHREQLIFWEQEIRRVLAESPSDPVEASLSRLLAEDPRLAGFSKLSPEDRERERYFLSNSIRGFTGYLARKDAR